jgi:hypothetical protein
MARVGFSSALALLVSLRMAVLFKAESLLKEFRAGQVPVVASD